MNPDFFQKLEAIWAPERMDAYRQDGASPAILEVIGWIAPELRQLALSLDRFCTIRQQGLDPWIEKIQHHC